MKYVFLILSASFIFIQCGDKQPVPSPEVSLGKVEFEVTGAEEAAAHFHEGLLLLHSFEFEDAAEKFVEAQKIDSNFVMAYWGEAMSYNHPLWRERFTDEGKSALEKLGDTQVIRLSKAKTALERDLLNAVEILYSEGDKKELDKAYKDEMEILHKKYPDHHEVASFYALSLLGASKNRKEGDEYERGAIIAQSIIDENPQHPGALHYLIHSYDDPEHAELALDAAHKYSKVAPDAEHALHMPSHIFVALGMWDEVVNSNIASYDASVERMKQKELDSDARGYHAFKWLMYGYLQKGEYDKARQMVYDMKTYCDEKSSSKARSHFIMMQGAYLAESEDWSDSIANVNVDLEKLNLLVQGVQEFTNGMSAYHRGSKEALNATIDNLYDMRLKAEKRMVAGSAKMCSGVSRNMQPPSVNEVNSLEVLELELKAYLAMLNDDDVATEKWLREATQKEESTTYTYGPPNIVKPSFELFGEWLLKKNRKKEASQYFEKVLERAPKRKLALQGIEKVNA